MKIFPEINNRDFDAAGMSGKLKGAVASILKRFTKSTSPPLQPLSTPAGLPAVSIITDTNIERIIGDFRKAEKLIEASQLVINAILELYKPSAATTSGDPVSGGSKKKSRRSRKYVGGTGDFDGISITPGRIANGIPTTQITLNMVNGTDDNAAVEKLISDINKSTALDNDKKIKALSELKMIINKELNEKLEAIIRAFSAAPGAAAAAPAGAPEAAAGTPQPRPPAAPVVPAGPPAAAAGEPLSPVADTTQPPGPAAGAPAQPGDRTPGGARERRVRRRKQAGGGGPVLTPATYNFAPNADMSPYLISATGQTAMLSQLPAPFGTNSGIANSSTGGMPDGLVQVLTPAISTPIR